MDTKSTKTPNKRGLKIFTIIMSCVLMFTGVNSIQKLADFYLNSSASNLVSDNFLDIDSYNILGNLDSEFSRYINADTRLAITLADLYISDEAVEDGSAFASEEEQLKKECELKIAQNILQEKKDIIELKYEYDYDRNVYMYPLAEDKGVAILEDFTSDNQIYADENSNGITTIEGIKYYKGYPLDAVTVDEDSIRVAAEAELKNRIISSKALFKSEYQDLKAKLSDRKNYSYFILNKETGAVYTNTSHKNALEAKTAFLKDKTGFAVSLIDSDLEMNDLTYVAVNSYTYTHDGMYYYSYDNYSKEDLVYALFGCDIDPEKYDVIVHVNASDETLVEGDQYYELYSQFSKYRAEFKSNITLLVLSVVLWFGCMAVLTVFAGSKDEEGNTVLAKIDKVPNSIHLLVNGIIVCSLVILCVFFFLDWGSRATGDSKQWWFLLASLIAAVGNLVFVEWLMSASRNVKCHQFFKNTITYKLFKRYYARIHKLWVSENTKLHNKNLKIRLFLPFTVYFILLTFFMGLAIDAYWSGYDNEVFFYFLIFIITVVAVIYIHRLAASLDSMNAALERARKGDFEQKLQVDTMPQVLHPLAENINNLTDGTKVAVDEAVRNERMKTELITNVSHDLKTPLTGIITYTDLLKHLDIEDEKAAEYIAVLDERALRLKKLIEDLVEASKASSGAIKLTLTKINMSELANQVFGEYEDALLASELDLRFQEPDEPVIAIADGQKTYRIIENLFSNVKKYAMHGTRVYLDLSVEDNFAVLSMKNISRDEMNFDAERLTDRFVRGDSSRSTEGSGLGLSIAKSLTELQGGKFEITVDGDLFKVSIKLPLESK